MSMFLYCLLIVGLLLVAASVYLVYLVVQFNLHDDSQSSILSRSGSDMVCPTSTTEALRQFIIDYIDDNFTPLAGASANDRLFDDLGLDSLDIQSMLSDVGHVTCTHPSVDEFCRYYGLGASVNDLVTYVRSLMVKEHNNG